MEIQKLKNRQFFLSNYILFLYNKNNMLKLYSDTGNGVGKKRLYYCFTRGGGGPQNRFNDFLKGLKP